MSVMSVVLRPYATAGIALAGAGLVAVVPIALQPGPQPVDHDVALTSGEGDLGLGDLLNVPINLAHDVANIPYNLFSADYSVDSLLPNFTTDEQHVPGSGDLPDGETVGTAAEHYSDAAEAWPHYDGPFDTVDPDDDVFHGALNFLAGALDYTGSWYESVPTNVWGWDTANTFNLPAFFDVLIPWAHYGADIEDNPIADNMNQLFEAESPIAPMDNKFFFNDPIGELQDQFAVPLDKLTQDGGFELPESLNPIGHENDPVGDGGYTFHEIFDGTNAEVDPDFGLGRIFDHLTDDPADNPIQLPDVDDIYPSLVHVYHASNVDFSPFDPGTDSLISYGASDLFGAPNLINGIFNGEHGLIGPDFPDVLPEQVTEPLGDALDDAIGPDSVFAQSLFDFAGRVQDLAEGSLDVFLPDSDPLYQTPSQVLAEVFSPGYVNASQTDLLDTFDGAGIELDDDTSDAYEVAGVLADNNITDILGGDVGADEVADALADGGLDIDDYDIGAGDLADALNGSEIGAGIGDLLSSVF